MCYWEESRQTEDRWKSKGLVNNLMNSEAVCLLMSPEFEQWCTAQFALLTRPDTFWDQIYQE